MRREHALHVQEFDLTRALNKLYSRPNSHKVQSENDLACWFNLKEFAEYHNINGHKVLGVFTSDIHGQRLINGEIDGVNKSHGILYLKCEDVSNVNVEQPLRLDGKIYQVEEAVKLANIIWRLKLSGTVS